jgi:hypothetical protein
MRSKSGSQLGKVNTVFSPIGNTVLAASPETAFLSFGPGLHGLSFGNSFIIGRAAGVVTAEPEWRPYHEH